MLSKIREKSSKRRVFTHFRVVKSFLVRAEVNYHRLFKGYPNLVTICTLILL